MGEYDVREKRTLSTLLETLDVRSKTILEAWHTEISGVSFGQQEQNESGSFSATQPFQKYGKREFIGRSNSNAQTWPTISSVSFDKYHADGRPIAPRSLEEMWHSENVVGFNSPTTIDVGRTNINETISNVFGGNVVSERDYKLRFLRATASSFANVPQPDDVRSQGEKGFNVGQVAPYVDGSTPPEYIFGDKRELDIDPDPTVVKLLKKIESFEQQLLRVKPGANRINLIFNIRVNLNTLLEQNLLMPSDLDPEIGGPEQQEDFATAIEEGRVSNINDDTFTKLYLSNRSVLHSQVGNIEHNRDPQGTIGGRSVADLEGPEYAKNADFTANDDFKVFKFEEDKERANQYTLQEGFIDNVAGNGISNITKGLSSLLPAVENDNDVIEGRQDKTGLLKTIEKMDSQAFPFLFETVNKHGSARQGNEYKQFCYLQATLQSLSESYAPSWTSKHFFGRTEQNHTYTMTDRTIDLSFVVFATEIRRLQNIYERITWLAQQTYASYDGSLRMKAGPLIRMSLGDMFSHLTGFIRSLSFDWSYLGPGGKWEITQGLRIPMACSVQMNFTVVHDDMPDRNYAFYPGPLHHPNGLIGQRGRTSNQPLGGPLINTANRKKLIEGRNRSRTTGRYEFEALEAKLFEVGRVTQNLSQEREAQYIDAVNHNMSRGNSKLDYTKTTEGQSVTETDNIF